MKKHKPEPSQTFVVKGNLVDFDEIRSEVASLVDAYGGSSSKCRAALLTYLKTVIAKAQMRAEEKLLEDGSGLKCAGRLSNFQDQLIGVLHEFAVSHIYRVENRSSGERMAVSAVGGYGRGTLAPGSDIDLLFILPYKQTPWGENVVEFILYMLWDLGFKVGHATRDVDECVRLSKQDITIRTAILEARFLWGDYELYQSLDERFDKEVVKGTGAEFIEAKMLERDERHKKSGGTRYLVEPNIKEGKGGLRDLQTLFWIAKYFYRVKSASDLVAEGVFDNDEYRMFMKSDDFLWAVRCHLHFLTKRAEERLSFDLQREMAQRLNYKTHAGLLDVERFIKHYFLVAKDVGDLTNILSAKLEEQEVKKAPGFSRLLNVVRRQRPSAVKGNTDFMVLNKRLIQADDAIFERAPINFIKAFKLADQTGLSFHPNLLHLIKRSLKLINKDLRANEEANKLFLDVLATKKDPETLLRKMNESGVLGRFVPDFGKVIAMMQFNMYHHYTVDEHTIRAVGVLSGIEKGQFAEEHPVAHEIINSVSTRMILFVALFLHDIAKGRDEDHSIAGAKVAKRFGKRMGLKPADTETISWLVLEHLTMSMVAQSRDLSDPKTIRDFANIVQTPERLNLLMILTVCDIRAVGPGVWNGWKGQLLRALYFETMRLLKFGLDSDATLGDQASRAEDALRSALTDMSKAEKDAYLNRHFPSYFMRTDVETQLRHATLIRGAQAEGFSLTTKARTMAFEGITEVMVYAVDQPNMLALLAGACSKAGAHILGAQIFTTRDGYALDMVNIRREFDDDADEMRRADRLSREIEMAISGTSKPREGGMVTKALKKSAKAFSLKTEIVLDNTLSNRFTVIEASGKDRGGLLHDLALALFELNLNISSAHIATFGERAVDVFYVTDLTGEKVENKARQSAIKRALKNAFEPKAKPKKKAA